jgi:hypothetical protein
MSRKGDKIVARLERVYERLTRSGVRCQKWVSKRGVPLIIVRTETFDMSICYFAHRKLWKVFWPWPSGYGMQRYEKLRTEQEVIAYITGVPTGGTR